MKPDLRIYREDNTEYWRDDIVARGGEIELLYVFDANRHVHACEMTPSYEMNLVGPTWSKVQPDDESSEQLVKDIRLGMLDEDQVSYVHVQDVDLEKCERISVEDRIWERYLEDSDGDREEALGKLIERVVEDLSCNGYIY